ncbi:HXXEE domain-containing protein [Streptococcus raffinosi]|uniref:HXXEE domain-containing protein n=1 Tax=Streptococcus raffinosi TaxID=3053355 RepID=A0ABT7LR83_9STRE|nr:MULTISPECIES: HXXEE domain-containing protein [unclassified Streptococcus]MDL5043157.1 HXXEE domain-containing protein [Streptococcus sp. VTCC 12812]MDM0094077.1 HXXEE domain-containing protein [Streptococcus sp. VTCC 12813]
MTLTQFYFLFPALFMLHELEEIIWMPSFVKKLSAQFPDIRFLSYYTPLTFNSIVMEQLLLLLITLYLSYQFNNYTIYTTIVIAYIYHIFGHLIQTIFLRKYVPGLLTGIFTSLFSLFCLKNNVPINLYWYSFITLSLILVNLIVSFMVLHKKNLKLR